MTPYWVEMNAEDVDALYQEVLRLAARVDHLEGLVQELGGQSDHE